MPSIEHYLLVDPEKHEIAWYCRATGGAAALPLVAHEGELRLDPPGIMSGVADIFHLE